MQKWHFIAIPLSLLILSACNPVAESPIPALTQASNTATPIAIPASYTPIPATVTPPQPTETSRPTTFPTTLPATLTAMPLLPEDLVPIDAGNTAQLQLITTLPVKEIYELAFSPSGNLLATLSEPWDDRFNDYLEVWDLSTGEQILLVDHWKSPSGLFFPDESRLYASNREYDLESGEVIQTLDVAPLAFSPDGKSYATGDYLGIPEESVIQLIDVETQKEIFKLTNPGMVMFLDISPDGHYLSGGFQGNHFHVKVWDIATQEVVSDLIDFSGLEFSPDSSVAASFKDGLVYLFRADGMTYLTSYQFTDPYTLPDTMDFSLGGDVLAIEDMYTIRFVIPETGKELLHLPNENMVKFSPDGMIVVTWIYQEDLKIWGVKP